MTTPPLILLVNPHFYPLDAGWLTPNYPLGVMSIASYLNAATPYRAVLVDAVADPA